MRPEGPVRPTVEELVRAAVADRGPLRFSDVVELALYDPDAGFYATGGQAGRRGDFITSPEVGPLFGAVVARAIDAWWVAAGRPARCDVVEVGAGPGALARTVLAAAPECATAGALHYVLVERSDHQRGLHAGLGERSPASVTSRATLPTVAGPCFVLANELLDNLPFDLLERTADGWAELRVTERAGALAAVLVPVEGPSVELLERVAPQVPVGARVPLQEAAADWLRSALALAGAGGRVVVVDYASTTAALGGRPTEDWLRTYRRHQRGGHPLEHLGEQDITTEVALDQLAEVRAPSSVEAQADWLRRHGIEDLVAEGRAVWEERAAIGDLAAVKARSRITEAAALLDPDGLGGFAVVEW